MDRPFLDANVLFSAAYRSGAGLLRLWKLRGVQLCSSRYALEEARLNLEHEVQLRRLRKLSRSLQLFDASNRPFPRGIALPDKDKPIFLAAVEAHCTHLLTGDLRHFGPYFGKAIEGILVLTPSDYLAGIASKC